MKKAEIKKMILSAMFIALGLVLPLVTGQIKEIGNMLLPMHFPVILCGLLCGPWYGLGVGLIVPLLRSVAFGMPVLYPTAVAMAVELGTYGLVSGALYAAAPWKCIRQVYIALVSAMLSGRVVWGVTMCALLGVGEEGFTQMAFVTSAFTNALPGIILQLVLIPSIMVLLKKARLMPVKEKKKCHD